jgi:hypothetical protein
LFFRKLFREVWEKGEKFFSYTRTAAEREKKIEVERKRNGRDELGRWCVGFDGVSSGWPRYGPISGKNTVN